jgi:hypothetical protein
VDAAAAAVLVHDVAVAVTVGGAAVTVGMAVEIDTTVVPPRKMGIVFM